MFVLVDGRGLFFWRGRLVDDGSAGVGRVVGVRLCVGGRGFGGDDVVFAVAVW